MTYAVRQFRRHTYPGADLAARGGKPPRISVIILGMTLVMALVALLASILSHLFAAA